jgi:hypothetical protein
MHNERPECGLNAIRFEFDNFRSHTRRNNRPNRWATDHNIWYCDLLVPLTALLIVQIEC